MTNNLVTNGNELNALDIRNDNSHILLRLNTAYTPCPFVCRSLCFIHNISCTTGMSPSVHIIHTDCVRCLYAVFHLNEK